MPEHIHIVLQPANGVEMKTVLWQLKPPATEEALKHLRIQPSAAHLMTDTQRSGGASLRFWQRGGGYDRNMRSPSDVHEKIKYIHENPVRRGLVRNPEDWPWPSAADWILQKPGPVPIDWEFMPDPELR